MRDVTKLTSGHHIIRWLSPSGLGPKYTTKCALHVDLPRRSDHKSGYDRKSEQSERSGLRKWA